MPGWFKNATSRRGSVDPDSDESSTKESAEAFRRGLEDHLKARAELFGIESREAGRIAAHKSALALAAVFLLLVAYALLLVGCVALIGNWLESGWPATFRGIAWQLVAISFGFLHFLVALILFKKLKQKPNQTLFEYTRAEFEKDRQWLKKKQIRKENDDSR